MKLLAILFLNLATVGVALVVYDQQRSEESASGPVSTLRVDTGAIEDRLSALEAAGQPLLRGPSVDARLLERLDVLEKRVDALGRRSEEASVVVATAEETVPLAGTSATTGEEPSAADVEAFRKLRAAARKVESVMKTEAHVAKALEKAGIQLTGEEEQQIARALAEFAPRHAEIWGEAKASGARAGEAADWPTIIAETRTVIQREFADRISDVVHASDADVISAAVHADGK